MAGKYDITWYQGDTFDLVLTWRQSNSDPVDLSGYTAVAQLRASADSEDVVLEMTTDDDTIVLGGVDGTITFNVSAVDMAAVPAGSYKYDLEMVSGDTVKKLLYGKFKVLAEVTR